MDDILTSGIAVGLIGLVGNFIPIFLCDALIPCCGVPCCGWAQSFFLLATALFFMYENSSNDICVLEGYNQTRQFKDDTIYKADIEGGLCYEFPIVSVILLSVAYWGGVFLILGSFFRNMLKPASTASEPSKPSELKPLVSQQQIELSELKL